MVRSGEDVRPVWSLCHNGVEVGEIRWRGPVVNEPKFRQRVFDGLNVNLGRANPFPEPLPIRKVEHRQVRPRAYRTAA